MIPSFEVLLALGVVGFYLLDSAMLLYANELVYLHARQRWSFIATTSHWQILGRYLYLPNLLTPEKALFRVCWSAAAPNTRDDEDDGALQRLLSTVDSLRYLVHLLWVLLIIGLPLTLIMTGTGIAFLLILGLVYGTIVALLVQVYRKRAALGLSARSFSKLAFDSLACAPLALNLVRKITLLHPLTNDPIRFAKHRFDDPAFSRLVETLSQWITNELEFEDEASPRYRNLNGIKQSLTRMMS